MLAKGSGGVCLAVRVQRVASSKSGRRFVVEDKAEPLEWRTSSHAETEAWIQAIHKVQTIHSALPPAIGETDAGGNRSGGGGSHTGDGVDGDIQALLSQLKRKDREIAMLRAENAALRRGEGQPAADAVVQGLRAEVDRLVAAEGIEGLELSDSDSDDEDDALFKDAKDIFGSPREEPWMSPRLQHSHNSAQSTAHCIRTRCKSGAQIHKYGHCRLQGSHVCPKQV